MGIGNSNDNVLEMNLGHTQEHAFSEAITEMIRLLESNDTIESIMVEALQVIGMYLELDFAYLLSINRDEKTTDVVADWSREDSPPEFIRIKTAPFFFAEPEETVIIPRDGRVEDREKLKEAGISSLISIPVSISETGRMFACFGDINSDRIWQLGEYKFLHDTVKIIRSILVKRIQKNSLASSYEALETILNHAGSAIYVRDQQKAEALFVNQEMKDIFRTKWTEQDFHLLLEREIEGENGKREIYFNKIDKWYDLYYTRMKWVDGRLVVLYSLYDISDKKTYQLKIEQQAQTDFLTGLFNRMCCERDLERYIEEARRKKGKGALLYLDLDDFKHINDGLGHQYGDVLLKSIAHALQRIKGIRNTCYRMGGDEFVIIIPDENYNRYEEIVNAIKEIFAKPWFLKDADYYCTMSMGVVLFPAETDNVHDLIKKADIAMYEAKKHGKNRVAQYSDGIGAKSGKRLDMEKNMRDATVSGYKEFEIYFQPIIDIQKEGMPCTGAEALIRWNSLEMGFVSPAEFIPLAEYLGLINPIGNYVLLEACKYCKQWNDSGFPDFKVNVNLSVVQLLQPDVVEIVETALKQTKIKPHNLTLEVTESLAINDMARMKEILDSIKQLGVRIALDDFGTGYSSLNHIREIPFDVIKVDQSFIKDLEKDAYSRSFIKMVVQLAEAIGVNICIEGVESKEQYRILADMNVNLVQGYYFDRPMPEAEFRRKYVQSEKKDLKMTGISDKIIV